MLESCSSSCDRGISIQELMDVYEDCIPVRTMNSGTKYDGKIWYELLSKVAVVNGQEVAQPLEKAALKHGDAVTVEYQGKVYHGCIDTTQPPSSSIEKTKSPVKKRKERATTAPYNLPLKMRKKESKKIGQSTGATDSTGASGSCQSTGDTELTGQSTGGTQSTGATESCQSAGNTEFAVLHQYICETQAMFVTYQHDILGSQENIRVCQENVRVCQENIQSVLYVVHQLLLDSKQNSNELLREIRSIKQYQTMLFAKQDQIQSTLHGDTAQMQSPTSSVTATSPFLTPSCSS